MPLLASAARPPLAAALAAAALTACGAYDPPPDVALVQPPAGLWTRDTPLELTFSEAIDPATLAVTVWPYDLDEEGELRPSARPYVEACTLYTSPCGSFAMRLDDARTRATLDLNDTFESAEGVPLLLEVHAGLADAAGRVRRVPERFDFQVSPRCGAEPVDIALQTGVIAMTANLQVLPTWLHLYLDFAVDPASGAAVVVGNVARLDAGLPPNYNHPDGFNVDLTATGWAVAFTACLIDQHDGSFYFQSDPFDVNILVLNTIPVTLAGFQVQGTLVPGSQVDGRDFASGTLSTTGGSFGDPPNPVDPITTAWDGFSFLAAELPPGLPRVCADDPCAAYADTGGDCQIPSPWEPGVVCAGAP